MSGFLEDNKYNACPVDIQQMPDGSILISDDWNDAIRRVSYAK